MKRLIGISFTYTFLLFYLFVASIFAQDWQEISEEHFIVYFTQDNNFAKEVLNKAEKYYRSIAKDLGYPRYKEFWLWEKRVKIFIYPDHTSFIRATNQPQWSQGMADYTNKQIISYAWSRGFLESLLPHEMAHLIFRDFVGFKGEIPLWLDEGVAQREEEARRRSMRILVKNLFEKNSLLSIEDMMRLDIRNLEEKEGIHIRSTRAKNGERTILLLSNDILINTYYLQSFALVDFLIEKYGSDRFAEFCRQLRDGKKLEEALKSAYPLYIQDLNDLEERWRKYLQEQNY